MVLLILNIIFCLSFTFLAYQNLNEIDPWLWVPIYMSAAICCALAMFEIYYPAVYTLLCVFYLVYAGVLFFSKDGIRNRMIKNKKPGPDRIQATRQNVMQTRGFFGLLIITAALIINYLAAINIF
jgi:hypothetical protein